MVHRGVLCMARAYSTASLTGRENFFAFIVSFLGTYYSYAYIPGMYAVTGVNIIVDAGTGLAFSVSPPSLYICMSA